jgi:uncharacterized membrane protein YwzB
MVIGVMIIMAVALTYLMNLVHKHKTVTKPAVSTTETLMLLNTLLTKYSSSNFIMRAVNSNTISNYGKNVTLRIPISRIVSMESVALQILISTGVGNNAEVRRDLGAPPGGGP